MVEFEGRGLLTETERAYLANEKEVANPRKIRQQIRQRIRASLADFQLLFHRIEERDLKQVLRTGTPEEELEEVLIDTLAFLYLTTDVTDFDFDDLAWEAFHKGYAKENPQCIPEISVEVTGEHQNNVEKRAREKQEKGRILTDFEVRALVETAKTADTGSKPIEEHLKRQHFSSESRIREYLKDTPDILGEEIEIVEFEPSAGDSQHPDILGRDADGNTVLIEIKVNPSERDVQAALDQLELLVDEFGGQDQVRGLLVTPARVDYAEYLLEGSHVEYRSLL